MNTDTGRIYEPEEYARRMRQADSAEAYASVMAQMEAAAASAEEKAREKAEQREFERAVAEGKIVEVSAEVAELVKLGQEAKAQRAAKRKAAKAARRKNRR